MFHSVTGIVADVLDVGSINNDSATARRGTTPGQADAAAGGPVLHFQRCRWCSTTMFRRLLCPVCKSSELQVERAVGVGVIRRSTVVHRNTPYARNVSYVEMAEGFTMRGRVKGLFIDIRQGVPVRLCVTEDAERREPVFELCDFAPTPASSSARSVPIPLRQAGPGPLPRRAGGIPAASSPNGTAGRCWPGYGSPTS